MNELMLPTIEIDLKHFKVDNLTRTSKNSNSRLIEPMNLIYLA